MADDTKLRGTVATPDRYAAIQKNLHKLEKWAGRNLTEFNGEFHVLHSGKNNSMYQYMCGPI